MSHPFFRQQALTIFGILLFFIAGCSMDTSERDLETLGLKSSYARQFGSISNDETTGIATDSNGNIYVAVNTHTSVEQAYIYKYDAAGNFIESKSPTGAPCCGYWNTYIKGIAGDKNGNVYVTGDFTDYSLRPEYAYVDKYDSSGTLVWTKKFTDTTVSYLGDPTRIRTNAISTDARGNVYIMVERAPWPYQTRNVSIRKYSPRGGFLWEKTLGSVSSYAFKAILTTDALGNIYTALPGLSDTQQTRANIYKWDTQGNFLWSQSINPPTPPFMRNSVHGLITDIQGNVYATGITNGGLEGVNQGSLDAFIRKYDASGNVSWTKQFGTNLADWSNGIAVDPAGNIYVVGSTQGNLLVTNKGNYDGFIRKYDPNGNALQARQFGTVDFDRGDKVTLDANNNVYVAGSTQGNMQGVNKGGLDVYIRKYIP